MILDAILKINPNAKAKVWGDDINTCEIEWLENTNPISKEDIKAKINETAYMDKRAKEYPSIEDQLDMQYWDKVNNTSTWQDKINEIKTKYPKE